MKLVCLVHATDRTGPPVALLTVLRHLVTGSDIELTVVTLRAGDLHPAFAALGDVRVVGDLTMGGDPPQILVPEEARRRARGRAALADLADADVVLVNTGWSVHALHCLPSGSWRKVVWVHELAEGLARTLAPDDLDALFAGAVRVVVGAGAVAELIRADHGVDPGSVRIVPYGIDLPAPPEPAVRPVGTTPRVVAAAIPTWRKAPDLFVRMASLVHRARPDAAFTWIGAEADHPDLVSALRDRHRLGLDAVIELHPPVADLRAHLAGADVFVLPSREDAFPLVVLEAGALAIPVVCFDHVGVAPLVATGGALVRYPDVSAMATAVVDLLADETVRAARGRSLAAAVRARHGGPAMAASVGAVLVEVSAGMGA